MFESELNQSLKKRLAVLVKDDVVIDDKLLLKLYCTFWLNDGNESDYGKCVWINTDVGHDDYLSLAQEVLAMDIFQFMSLVLGSYIYDNETVEKFIGGSDDYAWIAVQIISIKETTFEQSGRLNKAIQKELFERYSLKILSCEAEPIEEENFISLFYAINTFSLDQNWLAKNENKLNKEAEAAVAILNNTLLVSKAKQYEDCNRLYVKEPISSIVESFIGSRFCNVKTDEEISETYMQIANGLMRARNPLDVLCTIYLGKRTLNNTSFVTANDVTLENSLVYHFFTSNINPYCIESEYIVFAPSPFFIKKMASDERLYNVPVTFVVADENQRDIFIRHFNQVKYSGGKGNYFTFLSFDDFFTELEKEECYVFDYTLIFANNIAENTLKHLSASLNRYKEVEQKVMVISSDRYLQSFMHTDMYANQLQEVALVAEGIHHSTEPKRKMLWKYGGGHYNDVKITELSLINMKNKIQRMMPEESKSVVLPKAALKPASYDVRTAYRDLMSDSKETDLAKRNKPRSIRFSEEITLWYSLARNLNYPGQVRVEAYACEVMPEGKASRGFMARGNRIPDSVKRYTKVAESEVEKWIINDYPYSGLGKAKNNSSDVQSAISRYYKSYYAKQGMLCDITLRTLVYIYFEDINTRLSEKEQLILLEMIRGVIGELNTEYSHFGDYVYSIQEVDPDLTNNQLEYRLNILFEVLEVAVSYNHATKNVLEDLVDEESDARKKYLQVTNALIKNTFTRGEMEKIYQHICWHLRRGESEYLGLLIKLFTGLESEMVCALTWDDYIQIGSDKGIQALHITKEVSYHGNEIKPVDRITEYRTIPCCDILRIFMDSYLEQVKIDYPTEYLNRNIVVSGKDGSIIVPKDVYQMVKKIVVKLDIQDITIDIPYGHGRARSRNLNKYGGDVFKSNLRHWATKIAGFTNDELAYIAGNKGVTTLGRYYELHSDEDSLEAYYVKLNRLGAMFNGQNNIASEHASVFSDNHEITFNANGKFPAEIDMMIEVTNDTIIAFESKYGLNLQVTELK